MQVLMSSMKINRIRDIKLEKTNVKAYTYNNKDPVTFHGKFTSVIESKYALSVGEVFVIKSKHSGCLLSFSTAQELGSATLHLDTVSDSQDDGKIMDERITNILSDYSNVFQGLGKLKEYKVRLNIDESIEPVASKPRRIPFHIRKKVDAAIDSLIVDDIIEKIPDTQPTPWVSPIVVVGQKNDNVRLCIDMRKPNSAVKRTRYPHSNSQ